MKYGSGKACPNWTGFSISKNASLTVISFLCYYKFKKSMME
jgi:hypothetical protein